MPDLPVSKTYRYEVKELHTKHQKKLITDEEFNRRLDEMNKEEAKSNKSLGPTLIMEELGDIDKEIENEVKEEIKAEQAKIEADERAKQAERNRQFQRQEQERLNEALKSQQEQRKKAIDRSNYRNEIDSYINRLERHAQNFQKLYAVLQIILLVSSAVTAAMAGIDGVPRGLVTITGVIAAIAGGLLATFKIQDRIYASRKAIAEIRLERQKNDYRIDEYKDLKDEEAFIKFSRKITSIQGQEMLGEVELWNPRKEEKKEEKAGQDKIQGDREEQESDEIVEKASQEGKLGEVSEKMPQEEKPADNEK